MKVRTFVFLLVAVAALAATITVFVVKAPSSDGGTATFAYATERELVVMRDTAVVARVRRIFDAADSSKNKIVWTDDGARVALLDDTQMRDADPAASELISVDTRNGSESRIPCAYCDDFVAAGGSSLLVMAYVPGSGSGSDAKYDFFTVNLDDPGRRAPIPFPEDADSYSLRTFLAGTSGWVMTRQTVFGSRNTYLEQLEIVKVGSPDKKLVGRFDSNIHMPVTAEPGRAGEVTFAVAFRSDPGSCIADFPIYVIGNNGNAVKTDLSAAYPPGAARGIEVHDLWWGSDGRLRATVSSWTCDESRDSETAKRVLSSPSVPWRLDGTTWQRDSGAPVTMVRPLADDVRLALVVPDCIGDQQTDPVYCETGNLYRIEGENRTQIANDVVTLSTPPGTD